MSQITERLSKQIEFIIELDKLKSVYRQSYITDGSRRENDAEHSWHIAVMALVLAEHSSSPDINISKVIRMLLIHDIVEIYAGDTFIYDDAGRALQEAAERKALEKLLKLLPDDQGRDFEKLWNEFEEAASEEARFAKSLDRLQPLLLNYNAGGKTWIKHDVTSDRVTEINSKIADGSEALWNYAKTVIEKSVSEGILREKT